MDFEVMNVGETVSPKLANVVCGSVDAACASGNLVCVAVDAACAGVNGICGSDSNCSGGNVFPCENPGFGCRSGCGGAKWTNCVETKSL